MEGCSAQPLEPLHVDTGAEILKVILFGACTTGLYSSIFTELPATLAHSLNFHGMNWYINESVRQNRLRLLSHLVKGNCVVHAANEEDTEHGLDVTGCLCLACNHATPHSMTESIDVKPRMH